MWNCRGSAAKPAFINYFKNLFRQYGPDICYIVETRLFEDAISHVQRLMEPQWSLYMIATIGLSGGIIILWKRGIGNIDFVHYNRQVAFGVISPSDSPSWVMGVVYVGTCDRKQRQIWDQLEVVVSLGLSYCLLGTLIVS